MSRSSSNPIEDDDVPAFNPLPPRKAVELVEAAGIDHAERRIRDRAAAGLLKSYAEVLETMPVGGHPTSVRDCAIPTAVWKRIISEEADAAMWKGDTVRLAAAELVGGLPGVCITGIRFHERDVQRLIDHHTGVPRVSTRAGGKATVKAHPATVVPAAAPTSAPNTGPTTAQAAPSTEVLPIVPGAILATINQTMAATGFGRTKVNALMKSGTLVARKVGRSTRIEVASIMALGSAGTPA